MGSCPIKPSNVFFHPWTISVAFVRLSVCPSVAYIANNSRTQRPSVPKFRRKVSHLSCVSHTSFKVKTTKVRVTRPINTDKHRAPYLPNGKAYELQTWCTDVAGAMTSKVKGQGHVISLTRVGPMTHISETTSLSITKIARRVPHYTCYIAHQFQGQRSGSQAD